MTLVRLRALYDHWEQHPRAEWFIANYFKHEPKKSNRGKTGFKSMPAKSAQDATIEFARAMGLKPGMKIGG